MVPLIMFANIFTVNIFKVDLLLNILVLHVQGIPNVHISEINTHTFSF